MTTVLTTFFVALLLSLLATPLARALGRSVGAVDEPQTRKIHRVPMPRSGGLAILAAFISTVWLTQFLGTKVSELFIWETKNIAFFGGALVVFAAGFADDLHRLNPRIKFLSQVLAATIAFAGGLSVSTLFFTGVSVNSAVISYFLTVFWFVLLINSINLIDGLDGLAGGITFFVCLILTILLVWKNQYLPAMLFAALGGSALGFLRYNFNPASVFMGDGGSYFLGYAIAGLSIMGSAKAHTGTALLIPLLAMGIPVFDTILSPIRRFVVGKKLFQPDRSHIHHRLIEMGLSAKKAVLIIYGISIVLCLVALAIANFQDKRSGLFLLIIGVAAVLFTRKLGYFEYFASDKLLGWFRDVTDVAGFTHDRRSFLGLQIEMAKSGTMEELWHNVCLALQFLKFDRADLYVDASLRYDIDAPECYVGRERRHERQGQGKNLPTLTWQSFSEDGKVAILHWVRGYYRRREDVENRHVLKIDLPLINGSPDTSRIFVLYKDMKREQLDPFTLRRIEQLRETMTRALDWLEREEVRQTVRVGDRETRREKNRISDVRSRKSVRSEGLTWRL
jgi:UDP-GlcNAc:undecaprenyl-phosphate GlcNAc-1-phosphate transferase